MVSTMPFHFSNTFLFHIPRKQYYIRPEHNVSARLAQSVEHQTFNLRVVGSSPPLGAKFLMYMNSQCTLTWYLRIKASTVFTVSEITDHVCILWSTNKSYKMAPQFRNFACIPTGYLVGSFKVILGHLSKIH